MPVSERKETVLTGMVNETAKNVQKMERRTGQKISAENREIFDIMDNLSWSEKDDYRYRNIAFQNTAPDESEMYTCACCGGKFTRDEMDADHIVPRSRGGSNSRKNLQLLCRHCNRSKKDSMDDTFTDLARREREIERQNAQDAVFLDSMRKRR